MVQLDSFGAKPKPGTVPESSSAKAAVPPLGTLRAKVKKGQDPILPFTIFSLRERSLQERCAAL